MSTHVTHTTTTTTRVGRHIPANNNAGWGIIALVVLITLAANAWSYMIHKKTYRPFIHPSAQIPNSGGAGH
jgi:hypothetical protein